MKYLKTGILSMLVMFFFIACTSGSSSSSLIGGTDGDDDTETGDDTGDELTESVGYSIPAQLVLVGNQSDADASESARPHGAISAGYTLFGDETVSDDDFSLDETKEYIYDGTGDYLSIINQIFCALGQTQYTSDAVMDQGVQIILVNTSKCSSDYFYQTSGSNSADTYEEWLVDAQTNEDETATVYFRIRGNASGIGSLGFWYDQIDGQLDITEGVSETNQIGIFELNATGYYNDEVTFNATLASLPREDGLINLQFLMEYPSEFYSYESGVNAILDPEGTTGEALVNYTSTYEPGDGSGSQTYDTVLQINYNSENSRSVYASQGWNYEQCVDRNEKTETFVSYNLYSENSDGGLDRVDLNTGMSFQTENGLWGYASSWGVYAGETLSDGATVHGDDGNNYTVTVGDGMLMATLKDEYSFEIMTNKEIYGYDYLTYESYIMAWNGSEFVKTRVFSCLESGCNYFDVEPETITLAVGNYNYWVNGVGSVDFIVPEEGLTNDSTLFVSRYETLSPTDDSLQDPEFELVCFYQCPKGGLTQDDITNGTVYYTDDTIHTYSLDLENFRLVESEDGDVFIDDSIDMSGSYYEWGFSSGPMVLADSGITSSADVYSADAIYTWQVGTNEWNRYTGLINGDNQAVEFDSALSCLYENDEGTFILQYYDQGQLFGIPYVSQTDSETGFTVYASQFRIPDHDEVICDDETYETKAVYVQYQMDTVSNSECDSLDVEALDRASIEFTIPELPDMTPLAENPAVIGGVIQ